jgi:dihydrofolate reductase
MEIWTMAKLVYGMMQSLDGYVAGAAGGPGSDGYVASVAGGLELPPPGIALSRHFNDHVRGLAGCLYGRRIYEIMRYWDEDQPEWEAVEHDFAAAWRAQPKWVVSRSLKSVGANATLVAGDVEAFVRRLNAEIDGEIDVAGPELAGSLTDLGLIDEYRLYFRPFVLGRGKPYFAGARPPLRLIAADPVGEDAVRLTYVPT